jgi:hypothetical protein
VIVAGELRAAFPGGALLRIARVGTARTLCAICPLAAQNLLDGLSLRVD